MLKVTDITNLDCLIENNCDDEFCCILYVFDVLLYVLWAMISIICLLPCKLTSSSNFSIMKKSDSNFTVVYTIGLLYSDRLNFTYCCKLLLLGKYC